MSESSQINSNYFKYVFNKIEKELYYKENQIDLVKSIRLINFIKNSKSLLRDIYLISKVTGLEQLGKYLLFMLRKSDTGQINFENLIQNMDADKEVIMKILTDFFKSETPVTVRKNWEEIKKNIDFSIEGIKETEGERKNHQEEILEAEKKFIIEELDDELVTEEFIDKNIEEIEVSQKGKEDDYGIKKRGYLELIKTEEKEEDKKAFSLPGEKAGEDEKDETTEIIADETKDKKDVEEKEKAVSHAEENAAFGFDDLSAEPGKDKPEPSAKEKPKGKSKKKDILPISPPEEKGKSRKKEIKLKKEKKTPEDQLSFIEKKESETNKREEYKENAETLNKTTEAKVNTVYLEYESELITRNALLLTDLDELSILISSSNDEDRKTLLVNSVIENSSFMEENSVKMSFEIISNIYGIISLSFLSSKENNFDITGGNIEIFKNSLLLIESLIKGDTFEGYDKAIKDIEKIKFNIIESRRQKENLEKMEKDKIELEKHLSMKYLDTTQREKLILLKQYILEVETIFRSLDDIKSEFQIYEALRKLSSAFVRFKEMVNISRILNIRKLAQLSEASYIFVKFLQNYRLNPYDEEVKEILKFIIYNFKLIFLDKPTKDLDVFISILNDPVQLFSKSKGKKKNE